MRFKFKSDDLFLLYTQEIGARRYPKSTLEGFFDVMAIIENAEDERDIRAFVSLHFEKLKGNRAGQYSLRLDRQFRLIIQIERDEKGQWIWIISIEDYH